MKISILIPTFNEEDAIRVVINKVKKLRIKNKEIIIIDDGSTDRTYEIIKKIKGIKIFKHKKNMGKGIAIKTGINNSKGNIIINIDADNTYPVESIPRLIRYLKDTNSDLVIGSRFLGKTNHMPLLRYYGNVFFSKLISLLTRKRITDASSGMRAFRKEIIKNLKIKSRNLSWEVEMTTKVLKRGFIVAEIPIKYSERIGESKLNVLKDGFLFFIVIIRSVI